MNKSILLIAATFFIFQYCPGQNDPGIDLKSFYKPSENPVIKADSSYLFIDPVSKKEIKWQRADVFNPAAVVKDGKVFLLYRCEDNPAAAIGGRTSRLGLAESEDGIHFKKFSKPVLYPDNDKFSEYEYPGGCEDPRLVQTKDGDYILAYTAWNNKLARLCIAFSKDLFHWKKKGPAFAKAYGGKFLNMWSKSASMVTRMVNGKQVLAKINGKYWMYWGEKFVNLASSTNLYDWYPAVDSKMDLKFLAQPRSKKFDSDLTECGPPAVVMENGIVLFYNGKNATDANADPDLPEGMYSVGEMVFDKNDPGRLIDRSDNSFLKPTLPHEITGQYKAGTAFSEALILFNKKWFLYYGTADSFVGLAIANAK
ncbi:MAG TPA: glycoside hydrolase family 130 protein [Puia sp.]|nr:glycoside hydrolase family 130 protein [Puia sp.]